nr:uncharacterized protein LOC111861049 isoform X3 [Paramormyrops kingsleyae]
MNGVKMAKKEEDIRDSWRRMIREYRRRLNTDARYNRLARPIISHTLNPESLFLGKVLTGKNKATFQMNYSKPMALMYMMKMKQMSDSYRKKNAHSTLQKLTLNKMMKMIIINKARYILKRAGG